MLGLREENSLNQRHMENIFFPLLNYTSLDDGVQLPYIFKPVFMFSTKIKL